MRMHDEVEKVVDEMKAACKEGQENFEWILKIIAHGSYDWHTIRRVARTMEGILRQIRKASIDAEILEHELRIVELEKLAEEGNNGR